jgi:hypothetical protein
MMVMVMLMTVWQLSLNHVQWINVVAPGPRCLCV